MSPDLFQRADEVFNTVVEAPLAERPALLERLCAGDAELWRAVQGLLSSLEGASVTLRGAVEAGLKQSFADVSQGEIGTRAGPYLLVRSIGSGGMGSVYQAIRADGEYLHTVAVKLLHKETENEDNRRRFRAERQMLATLNHPNIAALLDGGQMEDGRPYLVMEFVEGEPLMEFCQKRSLDFDERLRLFRQVCDAVHYAHQRHIVHRDLKPGNILVAGAGTVKLVDFGIAKAMLPELVSSEGTLTKGPMRFLTPAYSTPEQITGGAVSPRTDVFALGLVLHELVTGRVAFGEGAKAPLDVHTAIVQSEPVHPSSLGAPAVIDAVVARCLKKDPAGRYASAAELEKEIERLLARRASLPAVVAGGRDWQSLGAAAIAGSVVTGLLILLMRC